jgi:glyoxylase-like metal-dependent hydrolase (beta-lactamase superfamily II)
MASRSRIGDHTWRVIVGRGHSPEHACLVLPRPGLLISGDQVLPRISSNVSVFPTEPDADPLGDWMLAGPDQALVPDDVLVLPAHNDPFRGLHARLDDLSPGHERGLDPPAPQRWPTPRRARSTCSARCSPAEDRG